jgi:hypothetical protein
MFDMLTTISLLAGFALVIVVGAKLGAGSPESLSGLFALEPMPARPRRVQEDDLPRFVFRDIPWRGTSASPASAAAGQLVGAHAA